MDLNIIKKGDVAVIKVEGSLDADSVAAFRQKMDSVFEKGTVKFAFDMSKLSFVDSMGLGSMISLLRRVRENKGDVKIFGLKNEVKDIFEITRLSKLFDIFASEEDVLKKFI